MEEPAGLISPREDTSLELVNSQHWSAAQRQRMLAEAGMHVLFFLVGLAPWLLVNALFMELPVFIDKLPEGNSIASYLIIIIQLGNIIPLAYVVLRQYVRVPYDWVIFATLGCAIATALLLAAFWDRTAHLFGAAHSVALMVLTLSAGLVGCFSVVSFFPFASLFKPSITAALSTGMGINGLVPSMMAVAQDPGGSRRFGVGVFFIVIGALLGLSLLAYVAILFLMHSARVRHHFLEKDDTARPTGDEDDLHSLSSHAPHARAVEQSQRLLRPLPRQTGPDYAPVDPYYHVAGDDTPTGEEDLSQGTTSRKVGEDCAGADPTIDHLGARLSAGQLPSEAARPLSSLALIRLLANPLLNQYGICLMNYVLVGMLPYAVSGYGSSSGTWLMWASIAGTVTGALGRFACSWFRYPGLTLVTLMQTPLWVFLMVISLLGDRRLVPEALAFLIVLANALFALLNGWEDTMAYIKVASEHPAIAERASTFVAAANQLGAFTGSLVSFLLVMFYLE